MMNIFQSIFYGLFYKSWNYAYFEFLIFFILYNAFLFNQN